MAGTLKIDGWIGEGYLANIQTLGRQENNFALAHLRNRLIVSWRTAAHKVAMQNMRAKPKPETQRTKTSSNP